MYRYVCPHCLRTWLDEEYKDNQFCWKCGQGRLVIVPPKEEKDGT